MNKKIIIKTFYSRHSVDETKLKNAYSTWKNGAINIPSSEKPIYYYQHFIVSKDILNYEDFKNIIKEAQIWNNFDM